MNRLNNRLQKLESERRCKPTAYLWLDFEQTEEAALAARFGGGPRPESVAFFRWAWSADEAVPDPSREANQ